MVHSLNTAEKRQKLAETQEPELCGTFCVWKELAAAILLTQQGRGMVRNKLGVCECLAFVICAWAIALRLAFLRV